MYIGTLPKSLQGSRSWIAVICIIAAACEVVVSLSEIALPARLPIATLTEYEVSVMMHNMLPSVFAFVAIMTEYAYVDIDKEIMGILSAISHKQKV